MTSRVQAHKCMWYPISHDEDGKPILWACGVTLKCIKTLTMAERFTKTGRERKGIEDMEEPPRWAMQN